MNVYINKLEHYSSMYTSVKDFSDNFLFKENQLSYKEKLTSLNEPVDLYEYIAKRGSKKKSNFTKVASYIAKKIYKLNVPEDRLGVIFATEFGNIVDMCNLLNLAKSSTDPISATIFPNSTISSATVTTSIELKGKGMNITINSGVLSFYNALLIAKSYIEDDKLDACVVLVGDDYNQFSIEEIENTYKSFNYFLSTINGVVLSKYKNESEENYIIKNIDILSKDLFEIKPNDIGFDYKNSDKQFPNMGTIDTYIGPAVAFLQLLKCLDKLENSNNLKEIKAFLLESDLIASMLIEKEV